MLTVQELVGAVPKEVYGVALATLVAYVSLRAVVNIDRVLKKLYPVVLLAGAYYRYQQLTTSSSDVESSLLLDTLTRLRAQAPHVEAAVGDLVVVALALHVVISVLDVVRKSRYVSKKNVLNVIGGTAVSVMKKIPLVSGKLASEIKKIEEQIEHSLKGEHSPKMAKIYELPAKGMADDKLVALMESLAGDADKKWQEGLVSGAVYHGEKDHLDVLNKAYALFSVSNPLHADIWPAVGKFEAEVIAMTASLMSNGSDEVCGTLSSGGTESIFLATKTHREYYRSKHGITKPEIIACVTAHAAIDKACEILGIKLIKVPMDPKTLKSDLNAIKWNITANTIMIYSSAPNFPNGIIDDIEGLSKIAVANDVGLHVDCCLGGFILPFAKKLRPNMPKFDFELPGVTSMSCDTHKYGYASKGTSVVLYKTKEIRRFQYFAYPDWTGGLYVTPTLAGSRPGALSAAAWASMIRLGYEGFMKNTEQILATAEEIKEGIKKIDGLFVLGDPQVMVICFGGKGLNILKVSDAMAKKGWSLNSLQHPASVHLCVTVRHIGKAKKFLKELQEAVDVVKQDPNGALEGGSAIYGMASSMPAGPVDDILRIYTDVTLKV
uniref:sphinganine-1-phosphate aldolase n=1 Tax=Globisporangium ultimum (strain ATCC 200006 / CBS 805.95 / DAOM BR144) TaxID=431595 RepID=K3WGG0_GLOUD